MSFLYLLERAHLRTCGGCPDDFETKIHGAFHETDEFVLFIATKRGETRMSVGSRAILYCFLELYSAEKEAVECKIDFLRADASQCL